MRPSVDDEADMLPLITRHRCVVYCGIHFTQRAVGQRDMGRRGQDCFEPVGMRSTDALGDHFLLLMLDRI